LYSFQIYYEQIVDWFLPIYPILEGVLICPVKLSMPSFNSAFSSDFGSSLFEQPVFKENFEVRRSSSNIN
jgi:hypothetical protein